VLCREMLKEPAYIEPLGQFQSNLVRNILGDEDSDLFN